jgi:tetratricopeptide (TPR) repeat protein
MTCRFALCFTLLLWTGNAVRADRTAPLSLRDNARDNAAECQRGNKRGATSKAAETLKRLKAAANRSPNDFEAQSMVGMKCYEMGRLEEAETYLRRALKNPSPNPADFIYLALVKEQQGKHAQAETYYQRAYQLSKEEQWNYSEGFSYFAQFLFYTRNDYARTETILREMRQRFPDDIPAKVLLARALIQGESPKMDEAHSLLTDVLKRDPKNAEAHFAMGQWHFYSKQDDQAAEKAYLKCLELSPNFENAMTELSHLYYESRNDGKTAEKWIRKAIVLSPKDGNNYVDLAYALFLQNRIEEARKAAEKAVALGAYDKEYEIFERLGVIPETQSKDEKKP